MPLLDEQASTAIYSAEKTPLLSCELMADHAAATSLQRGRVSLHQQPSTGLISNILYDESTQLFSSNYVGSQHASERFNRYCENLARQLSSRHQLSGKTVLEVGCGDGSFLDILCKTAKCEGIGIDPACTPMDRTHKDSRVSLLPLKLEAFALRLESEPDLASKIHLIICRHTLEHIGDCAVFLRQIRKLMDRNRGTALYLDVPDARRIFQEGAFWDIYYEHCHYFTPQSLASVFALADLHITDMACHFDSQYISVTAHCEDSGFAALPDQLPDDLSAGIMAQIESWQRWFAAGKGHKTVLWGGGSKAVSFISTLQLNEEISAIVDIHPLKQKCFLPGSGHRIVAPEDLLTLQPDFVIVMNPAYKMEVRAKLMELGLNPALIALGADLQTNTGGSSSPVAPVQGA